MPNNTLTMLETLGMEHRAIISQLEQDFPPVNPSPDDSIEKIMYQAGQRSVIEWLINRIENNG